MYPNQQNPYGSGTSGNSYPPYPPASGPGPGMGAAPAPGAPRGIPQPPQSANPYGAVPALNNSSGASGHNPYEFIMNPNATKRKIDLSGASFGKQIGIFAGIALVVVIGAYVALNATKPKSTTPELIAIAQRQQEIIRIATGATNQVNTQSGRNFIINTSLAITTSQSQVIGYLAEGGTKLKAKQLSLDEDSKTDTLLSNAQSAGNYDSTVAQVLTTQLETYEGLLQTTYKKTVSRTTKQLVQKNFDAVAPLLEQAKSVSSTSSN